jgi:hypothetical protein
MAAVSSEGYNIRTDIVTAFIDATARTRARMRDREVRQRAQLEEQAAFLGFF